MIGAEWLLNRSMLGHPCPHLNGPPGYEHDRYGQFGTDRLNRVDPIPRPEFDISRNQVRASATGGGDRLVGRDREIKRSEATITQGFLDSQRYQRFIFNDQGMHGDFLTSEECASLANGSANALAIQSERRREYSSPASIV
jgi:hypothetical protein